MFVVYWKILEINPIELYFFLHKPLTKKSHIQNDNKIKEALILGWFILFYFIFYIKKIEKIEKKTFLLRITLDEPCVMIF